MPSEGFSQLPSWLAPSKVPASPARYSRTPSWVIIAALSRAVVPVPVSVQFGTDGSARVQGKLTVSLEAYQIERPSLLLVKLDDACTIAFDLKLGRSG